MVCVVVVFGWPRFSAGLWVLCPFWFSIGLLFRWLGGVVPLLVRVFVGCFVLLVVFCLAQQ